MHCVDAGQLMMTRLDGCDTAADDSLDGHLLACDGCRAEWEALAAADELLRSQHLVAPSPHFAAGVMAAVAHEATRPPPWLRASMHAALVLTGVLALASGLVSLLAGSQTLVADSRSLVLAAALVRDAFVGVQYVIVWHSGVDLWPLYCLLAVAIALTWFGVLVMPRHTLQSLVTDD